MDKIEVTKVKTRSVSCEGTPGVGGHPKVYLQIAKSESKVKCPYCAKVFQYSGKDV